MLHYHVYFYFADFPTFSSTTLCSHFLERRLNFSIMPQPQACKPKSRVREELESRISDKTSMRYKTFNPEQREKELQVNLRELSCESIPSVEEVNLFKSDGTVIQFISPKMEVNTESNTYIVSGDFSVNKIDQLQSDIVPQAEDLTPDTDAVTIIDGDDQKDINPLHSNRSEDTMHSMDPNVPVNSSGFMVGHRVKLQIGKTGVVRYVIFQSVLLFIPYHVCNISISIKQIRYIGKPDPSHEELVGIELDAFSVNAGDGSIYGQQLFKTTPGRGFIIRSRFLSNIVEPAKITEGSYARLKNLNRVPKFNGKMVKIVRYIEEKGRWKVAANTVSTPTCGTTGTTPNIPVMSNNDGACRIGAAEILNKLLAQDSDTDNWLKNNQSAHFLRKLKTEDAVAQKVLDQLLLRDPGQYAPKIDKIKNEYRILIHTKPGDRNLGVKEEHLDPVFDWEPIQNMKMSQKEIEAMNMTRFSANTNQSDQPQTVPPIPPSQAQFKYVWQWRENDGTWHDYDATTQLQLDMLSIGNKITISAGQIGQWTYDITRTATDQCSLCFLYLMHSVCTLSQSKRNRSETKLNVQSKKRFLAKGAHIEAYTDSVEWSKSIESIRSTQCSKPTKSMEWQWSKCRTSAINDISKWICIEGSNQRDRNGTVRVYVAVFGERQFMERFECECGCQIGCASYLWIG